jgi:hypothetical protein
VLDVLIVVYNNYDLISMQVKHWQWLCPSARLLFCDTTPAERVRQMDVENLWRLPVSGIDGETHGAGIDFLLSKATSDIVCVNDSDFFWLCPQHVEATLTKMVLDGYYAIGAGAMNDDIDWARLNRLHPTRAGYLAPVAWGMFIWRHFALKDTWVVTKQEAGQIIETGWRTRKRLIDNDLKREIIPAFRYPGDGNSFDSPTYFGEPNAPVGFHYLRGSSIHAGRALAEIPGYIQKGVGKWLS